MNAQQWYWIGGILLTMGVLLLVTSQIVLGQWLKTFKEE